MDDDDDGVDFASFFSAPKKQKPAAGAAGGSKSAGIAGKKRRSELKPAKQAQKIDGDIQPAKKQKKAERQQPLVGKQSPKLPTVAQQSPKAVARSTAAAVGNGAKQEDRGDHQKSGGKTGKGFWPFEVDYLDHFETSATAVQDIAVVLHALCKALGKQPSQLAVYDPFYCKGGIRRHYEALGFTNFIHRKRDFYADVASGQLPAYDILVTNPPYSGDHKERVLDFVLRSKKPWALLLPNYVATKQYYGQALAGAVQEGLVPAGQQPFYLTPSARYSYDHPEGTGHSESPFYSIWYVWPGRHTQSVMGACQARLRDGGAASSAGGGGDGAASKKRGRVGDGEGVRGGGGGGAAGGAWAVSLARSVDELRSAKAVPVGKRLNPKQRARLKAKMGGG